MADRPITFSGPMVRAILEDRKSQTRRAGEVPRYEVGDRLYVREAWRVSKNYDGHSPVSSKKGQPILEPRTMTVLFEAGGSISNNAHDHGGEIRWQPSTYEPSPAGSGWVGKYRQAMHMPRWASRLWLEVTEVRVQRLHDISSEDCIAEGVRADPNPSGQALSWSVPGLDGWHLSPQSAYFRLLDSLHGERFSASNPWLVAYSFTHHLGNIDVGQ